MSIQEKMNTEFQEKLRNNICTTFKAKYLFIHPLKKKSKFSYYPVEPITTHNSLKNFLLSSKRHKRIYSSKTNLSETTISSFPNLKHEFEKLDKIFKTLKDFTKKKDQEDQEHEKKITHILNQLNVSNFEEKLRNFNIPKDPISMSKEIKERYFPFENFLVESSSPLDKKTAKDCGETKKKLPTPPYKLSNFLKSNFLKLKKLGQIRKI